MAPDTPSHLRNLVIYSVYTRNHGPTGTFADVSSGRLSAGLAATHRWSGSVPASRC